MTIAIQKHDIDVRAATLHTADEHNAFARARRKINGEVRNRANYAKIESFIDLEFDLFAPPEPGRHRAERYDTDDLEGDLPPNEPVRRGTHTRQLDPAAIGGYRYKRFEPRRKLALPVTNIFGFDFLVDESLPPDVVRIGDVDVKVRRSDGHGGYVDEPLHEPTGRVRGQDNTQRDWPDESDDDLTFD